jgi:hypothetical protein
MVVKVIYIYFTLHHFPDSWLHGASGKLVNYISHVEPRNHLCEFHQQNSSIVHLQVLVSLSRANKKPCSFVHTAQSILCSFVHTAQSILCSFVHTAQSILQNDISSRWWNINGAWRHHRVPDNATLSNCRPWETYCTREAKHIASTIFY